MKHYFLLSLTILCLMSCKEPVKRLTMDDRLTMAISSAQNSQSVEIDTFLGFKLGMSSDEVVRHLVDLDMADKIYFDDNNKYAYDFNTKDGALKINFRTEFHNDSLYKIDFVFAPDKFLIKEVIMMSAKNAFEQSLKESDLKGFDDFITKDIFDDYMYTYIKDNLIVRFQLNPFVCMSYINAPVEYLVEQEKEQEAQQKHSSTVSDF